MLTSATSAKVKIDIAEYLTTLELYPGLVDRKDKSGKTALMVAVQGKRIDFVLRLLKIKADWSRITSDMRTPLGEAVKSGFYEAVAAFLFGSVGIPTRTTRTMSHQKACDSALFVACSMGHISIVKLLLQWNAYPHAADEEGCTPIMRAAEGGNIEVLKLLLDHGARIHTVNKVQRSALHLAAAKNKACMVRFLCGLSGVTINAIDADNLTALGVAAQHGHLCSVRELLRAGADTNMITLYKNTYHWVPEITELLMLSSDSVTPYLEPSNKRGMWAIPHSKIPAYLHKGAFYESLDAEDESLVHVPFDCIRLSDQASNLCEFSILLRAMQFWVLDCIPDGVIEYCFYHECHEWRKVALSVLGAESIVYRDLCAIYSGCLKNVLLRAIRANRVEIVRFLASVSLCASLYRSVTAYTARMGKLESLRALHECNVAWDRKTCAAAAAGGHLECLKYAHENGCDWDEGTLMNAALHGRWSCVEYAMCEGCPCHQALCGQAAQGGDLSCVQYLISNGWTYLCNFSAAYAAQRGHVETLRYLRENNCPWNEYTVQFAARAGKLTTLRYALENGCPFTRNAVAGAAEAGSLSCLKYLLETVGVPGVEPVSALAAAMLCGKHECFDYLLRMGFRIADFSFLSKPFTKRQRKCIAKKNFDAALSLCLMQAVEYGMLSNNYVTSFIKNYKLKKCEVLMRIVNVIFG